MTKTKLIGAALSAILISGCSTAMPADMTQEATSVPAIYETDISADENQLAIKAKYEAGVESADSKSAVVETTNETEPVEVALIDIEAPVAPVSSAISSYYVKPGDQQAKTGLVLNWTDFQMVTETYEDEWIVLTGVIDGIGDWTFKYTVDGDVESSGVIPLTYYHDDCAIGLPLACNYGPTTVKGWTFMVEIDDRVCYSHAPGACYVFGDGWDAIVLDARRYAEWKGGENFHDPGKYTLVAYNSESWVIASEGTPNVTELTEAEAEAEVSDINALADKIVNKMMPLVGVSDPKWGAINWAEYVREEPQDDGSTIYWLEAELNGCQFSIEIDDTMPLGFAENHKWSAAIMPADFVTRQNDSTLYHEQYAINIVGNDVCIVNTATDVRRNVSLDNKYHMDSTVCVLTLTDGKHAKCVTLRPELISFIYAISSK